MGLENVEASRARAEDINEEFDFVVSRAVTRLGRFYPWVKKKLTRKSRNKLKNGILYLKGGDLLEELQESRLKK